MPPEAAGPVADRAAAGAKGTGLAGGTTGCGAPRAAHAWRQARGRLVEGTNEAGVEIGRGALAQSKMAR